MARAKGKGGDVGGADTWLDAEQLEALRGLTLEEAIGYWDALEAHGRERGDVVPVVRMLCRQDLFYLLVRACGRRDMVNEFAYARCREFEADPDGHLDLWAREHFKTDLADNTPILTANRGWTTHGELVAGDRVFAPDGKPVQVQAVTPQYTDSRCMEITFSDGARIVAGVGHLWKLRVKHKLRVSGSDERYIQFTERIVESAELFRAIRRNERLDVSVCAPLEMPVAELPIDPYVLGAWLGDGTASKPVITCADADKEIMSRIEAKGYVVKELAYARQGNCGNYAINPGIKGKKGTGLTPTLRAIGVFCNKHIPEQYLSASLRQRMELLRGLMDTDGDCNSRGTATFCNANRRLADGVYRLAVTLGLRPRFRKNTFASMAEKAVNGRYTFYQVSFQAHKDRNPFALQRKAERAIDAYLHRDTRLVEAVVPIQSVPTRCIQVEGGMYVAGRELIPTHNSIITFGKTVQDILSDPEVTFGIFSHTRPIAKAFLRQIMRELETNRTLHAAFPDVLWGTDTKQSPKWSEDDGIIVKRRGNPNEATVEAWGLVDGQPVSKHFKVLLYDDIVVQASVTTPEMIAKTMSRLEESYSLGTTPGGKRRFAGTRWHFNDAYRTIMDRGTAVAREHPGRVGGTEDGQSVYWDDATHESKRRDMGPYTYAAQILLNPKADALQGFRREWLRYYKRITALGEMNKYILVDAASSKKKGSDYTSMWCVGLAKDGNYYALDMVRDRLNLKERADRLFDWHRKYKPKQVRYERYGMMADIEHIKARQESENYRFDVTEVAGVTSKADRIKRLLPIFEQGRFYLPESAHVTDWQKQVKDLVHDFVEEEYFPFPVGLHDDMLDALARIAEPDLKLIWPKEEVMPKVEEFQRFQQPSQAWMA